MQATLRRTFASFHVRNFKLYFIGQGLSLCGTWMQTIALTWLVLKLTHSGTQLGLVTAAQFLPILLFGVWGGVLADRLPKRRVLYVTQSLSGILALLLAILVATGDVRLWMVYVIASAFGLVLSIDNPSRQSFVVEMVGSDLLKNAVTLNSTVVNAARVIGPSIAGVLIATVGIAACFFVNAGSFIAVLIALRLMHEKELFPAKRTLRAAGQIRAGLRYAWRVPTLRATLLMMVIIGTFAYEFPVILPLFSTITLHGNAATYSALTAAMGVGAVIGGLYVASRNRVREKQLIFTALLFGLSILLAAIMPNIVTSFIVFMVVGALSVAFISIGNTTLQLTSEPTMRGRVMALWSIAFQGTTPIGGPLIGAIADHANPRIGLMVGGVSALIASGLGLLISRQHTTMA
jgi:MFS family permease